VPVFEIREVAGMTDLLVRSKELGQALARTLEGPLTFLDPQESAKVNGGKGINPERAWDMWVRSVSVE
jgi:hypothetical protein